MLKSPSLFWESLDASSPCQAFKNAVLRHLLKTDVALCDIGTRLPGDTRCTVWPETEPRESEATTYFLLLLSAPHNPQPYEVYLNSLRVSGPRQTPGNIMLGEWVREGMSLFLYADLRMFNLVNLCS